MAAHSEPQLTIPEGVETPAVFVQPIATQPIAFQPITTITNLDKEPEGLMSNILVTQPLNLSNQCIATPCDKECSTANAHPGQTITVLPEIQGKIRKQNSIALFEINLDLLTECISRSTSLPRSERTPVSDASTSKFPGS